MSHNTKEQYMGLNKDYEDIPGTFVFDADRGREGTVRQNEVETGRVVS